MVANEDIFFADINYILKKMYPPFVTQKVEPKCAATDAAERAQRASLACTMPSREEENYC